MTHKPSERKQEREFFIRFQVDKELVLPPEGSEALAAGYAGAKTHEQAAQIVQRRIAEDQDGMYRFKILDGTKPSTINAQVHQRAVFGQGAKQKEPS